MGFFKGTLLQISFCVCVSHALFSHLLVVGVTGTSDEGGPTFGMELKGSDAVSSVPFSRDLWSQDLQAVPGGEACKDTSAVKFHLGEPGQFGYFLHLADLLEEEGSCWSRFPDEEFQLIWKLTCLRLQHRNKVTTSVPKMELPQKTNRAGSKQHGRLDEKHWLFLSIPELRGVRRARSIR